MSTEPKRYETRQVITRPVDRDDPANAWIPDWLADYIDDHPDMPSQVSATFQGVVSPEPPLASWDACSTEGESDAAVSWDGSRWLDITEFAQPVTPPRRSLWERIRGWLR